MNTTIFTIDELVSEYNKVIFSKEIIFYNFIMYSIKKLSLFSESEEKFNDNKKTFKCFLNRMHINLNSIENEYLNDFKKIDKENINFIIYKLKNDLFKDIKNKNEDEIEKYVKDIVQWQKILEDSNVKK